VTPLQVSEAGVVDVGAIAAHSPRLGRQRGQGAARRPPTTRRELAAEGVHLSLWQTPSLVAGSRVHDRLAQAGGFVRTPQGEPLDIGLHVVRGYRGPVHVVDWTNPEAVRVMREEYGRLLATGAAVGKAELGEELLHAPPGVELRR
jgi:alpha-glucosidase (family GH31 glycosyl hydrolase)